MNLVLVLITQKRVLYMKRWVWLWEEILIMRSDFDYEKRFWLWEAILIMRSDFDYEKIVGFSDSSFRWWLIVEKCKGGDSQWIKTFFDYEKWYRMDWV